VSWKVKLIRPANKSDQPNEWKHSCKSTQHTCCLMKRDRALVFMNMLYSYTARHVTPPSHVTEMRSEANDDDIMLTCLYSLYCWKREAKKKKKLHACTSRGCFVVRVTTPPTHHNNYNCAYIENKLARKKIVCPLRLPA
jgi:hypothetical protein